MLTIVDNYDSFTYNLAQYFGEIGVDVAVYRNDRITVAAVREINPRWLVISPGPGTPEQSGISMDLLREFSGKVPVLGVCLGHQCIGEVFGGKVIRAPRPMHGKISSIVHQGTGLFQDLPNPLEAVRYHSLVIERANLPDILEVTATSPDGLIMGLRHRSHSTFGIQFHPESVFTDSGKRLLENFIKLGRPA